MLSKVFWVGWVALENMRKKHGLLVKFDMYVANMIEYTTVPKTMIGSDR